MLLKSTSKLIMYLEFRLNNIPNIEIIFIYKLKIYYNYNNIAR